MKDLPRLERGSGKCQSQTTALLCLSPKDFTFAGHDRAEF